ncbi:MAG: hypothetical protein HQM13_07785 [SAR324 cluster bacterium]|nr:hypothetical protein [SAR324 cluster bacterium]
MKTFLLSFFILLTTIPLYGGEVKGKIQFWERSLSGDDWILSKSHENAVVFITGLSEEAPKDTAIYHDQFDKTFLQRVMPITSGQTVTFRNRDPVNHNVWSLSKAKSFDLGLFKAPVEKSVTFEKPGIVKIFCNIHPQMIATFLVLKNNKYFLTREDGAYSISNIPAGNYKLRVWVEGTKLTSKEIKVTESSQQTIEFPIKVIRSSQKHLNKFGKPYKKY